MHSAHRFEIRLFLSLLKVLTRQRATGQTSMFAGMLKSMRSSNLRNGKANQSAFNRPSGWRSTPKATCLSASRTTTAFGGSLRAVRDVLAYGPLSTLTDDGRHGQYVRWL